MKTTKNSKAFIKQGFYERNAKTLRGALDFEQEVLDTLVRKGILTTEDCCTYSVVTEDSGPGYLEYIAFIEGDGTNPVTFTVFNSTASNYLGDITWAVSFTDLVGTKIGAFTTGKTWIQVSEDWNDGQRRQVYGGTFEEDTVYLTAHDNSDNTTVTNVNFYIQIRVYP